MRKIVIILFLLALGTTVTLAQDRVKEKNLRGEWKMIIDIDMQEVEEDLQEDSWLGWVIGGAVSGIVENVLDEVDINMKFMEEGKLKITVYAFGEEEIEYGEWFINKDGQLIIIDDDGYDDDEVWMMDGDNLVAWEVRSGGKLERQQVYLKPL